MTPADFFAKYPEACETGKVFAHTCKDMSEVWDTCPRSDWLLWICKRVAPIDKITAVRVAVFCARQNYDKLKDPRSIAAIEAAEGFIAGTHTAEQCSSAYAAAAAAAYTAAAAAYTAAAAAYTAAAAAAYAADADAADAAYSAAAAYSANVAAYAADADAADADARRSQADYIRSIVPNPFKGTL